MVEHHVKANLLYYTAIGFCDPAHVGIDTKIKFECRLHIEIC
jgi:hypothetical protein